MRLRAKKRDFRATYVHGPFLKSGPFEREMYAAPPLVSESAPETRLVLSTPLYGIPNACDERYLTLRDIVVIKLGGSSTSLCKSASFGVAKISRIILENV